MDDEPPATTWRRFQRLRRSRRGLKRRARRIETASLRHAHTFLIKRWDNARSVRRHAMAWLLLVSLLIGGTGLHVIYTSTAYMTSAAVSGGVYAEGVAGPLETINPLFAVSSAERAASRLMFSGLLGYDQSNHLRGDLAESWHSEHDGKRYVVQLRRGLQWHDGQSVTADDVVFTVARIKNPLTRSVLYRNWTEVTASKVDTYTVVFDLNVAYAPFPHALTFGILPVHLLGEVSPGSLREHAFNRQPVGTGPFVFRRLQIIDADRARLVVYMDANHQYMHGTPQLDRFQLHVYKDHDQIRQAFLSNEITAAADLDSSDMADIQRYRPTAQQSHAELYNGVYAFFKLDSPLLADLQVRQALRLGLDRSALRGKLGTGSPLEGPLLNEQMSITEKRRQPAYDRAAAEALLDKAGWLRENGGVRHRGDQKLQLTVVTPRVGDYPTVMASLAEQWRAIGVDVTTQLVDADTVQQNVLLPRAYDVFIYELAIGADPDVYAYWHSTQADPRGLNLSDYRSVKADDALASAQSRAEPELRQKKYEVFVDQWLADAPAIALYQPTLHYVSTASAVSVTEHALADSAARYYDVDHWMVQRAPRYKTP